MSANSQGRGVMRRCGRCPCAPALTVATMIATMSSTAGHAQVAPELARPAERTDGAPPPNVDAAVLRLLESAYLTPEEGRKIRAFHGIWRDGDLNSPASTAAAALLVGAPGDPSLSAAGTPDDDRAEAAVLRGDASEALAMLVEPRSVRALRVRAQALETLGRMAEAAQTATRAGEMLADGKLTTAPDITEGVRCLAMAARLRGTGNDRAGGERREPTGNAADEYRAMMSALDSVRNGIDRLYWPALLLQAEILYDKDNGPEAEKAAREALALNPSCAAAWSLLGHMAVDSFNFEASEQIAARLDELAAAVEGQSVYSAAIRARALLRLRDPDAAESMLKGALAFFPRQRELLALTAAMHASRFEFDAARQAVSRFEELSPGSPAAVFEVGMALSEARQYAESAAFLEEAARRLPAWPAPLIELGLLRIQAGEDELARPVLEKATALDPFNVRADNSLRLVRELLSYSTVESEHFIVRYKPGADEALAMEMPAVLERMHATVTGTGDGGIDHQPARKTIIDMMPDHEWFGVRIAGLPRIHTIAASTGPVIAMEAPRDGKKHPMGTYDWARVLQHEYTHTVTLSRTRNRIPHWFTEAAAVYLELSPREYATCQLLAGAFASGSLFDLTQINVAFVRPKGPADRQLAYAQGHWMYQYIIERWGREAPLKLMDLYAQGVLEASAFETVLGEPRGKFLEDFKEWARAQLIDWGMLPRPGEPDVRKLLLTKAAEDGEFSKATADALTRFADASALRAADGPETATEEDTESAWPAKLPVATRQIIESLLGEHPQHPDLLELLINLTIAESPDGKPSAELAPILERYARARPVDPRPHRLLATLYLGTAKAGAEGNTTAAIPHLRWLDAREQHLPTYAVELARLYASAGDWEQAGLCAERATIISPYDADYRELAAAIALKRGDFDTAERHVRALCKLEPDRKKHAERLEALLKQKAAAGR